MCRPLSFQVLSLRTDNPRERKGVAFCACLSTVCDHQVPSQVVLCRIGEASLPLQFYTDLPFNTHSFSSVCISMYTSVNIRTNLFVCMQPLRERGGEEGQMSTDTNRDSNKPPPFNLTASDTGAGLTETGACCFSSSGIVFVVFAVVGFVSQPSVSTGTTGNGVQQLSFRPHIALCLTLPIGQPAPRAPGPW